MKPGTGQVNGIFIVNISTSLVNSKFFVFAVSVGLEGFYWTLLDLKILEGPVMDSESIPLNEHTSGTWVFEASFKTPSSCSRV